MENSGLNRKMHIGCAMPQLDVGYCPLKGIQWHSRVPSLFHCPVSGPHGGGQQPSPLARVRQSGHPHTAGGGGGGGQRRLWGPRMSTCGVRSPTWAQNNLPLLLALDRGAQR